MAGGHGNIKPKDGKQFTKEYQPPEKWTEKKALELGNELIEWLNVDSKRNLFFNKFLVLEKNLHINLIKYLREKFTSFDELVVQAKEIQEIKLIDFGVCNELNSTITKLVLSNHHGYSDKSEIKQETIKPTKYRVVGRRSNQ